jgi:hypothetical protein
MATTSTRGKNPQTAQPLFWLLWRDALLAWGFPITLIGAIIGFALLGAFEQITQTTGVLALGGLLLLLVCFLLFKPLLTHAIETKLKSFAWGLALAWLAITCVQFYFSIFVGQEITSGAITKESSGMELSLGARGTVYDLVIEGNFATAAGQGGREGGYTLLLEKDGQRLQELTGNFSETLARQRLGRRGSTMTHRLHNHSLHPLVSPGEGIYRLTVAQIDPQLAPTLQASLYRDTYPQKTFWLLDALLLIGAYIGETWQVTLEIPLVLVTAAALTFVVTFRNIGVPPHSYQDIIGAFLVAALAGPLIGWLFRSLTEMIVKAVGFSKFRRKIEKKKG